MLMLFNGAGDEPASKKKLKKKKKRKQREEEEEEEEEVTTVKDMCGDDEEYSTEHQQQHLQTEQTGRQHGNKLFIVSTRFVSRNHTKISYHISVFKPPVGLMSRVFLRSNAGKPGGGCDISRPQKETEDRGEASCRENTCKCLLHWLILCTSFKKGQMRITKLS